MHYYQNGDSITTNKLNRLSQEKILQEVTMHYKQFICIVKTIICKGDGTITNYQELFVDVTS